MKKYESIFKRISNLAKPFMVLALFTAINATKSAFSQTWNEIIKTVASDRGAGDEFGYSVAISGDYAIVGSNREDEDATGGNTLTDAGSAYIFQNVAGTWSQVQKIVASDREAGDEFGYSVAISGDYAIIGAKHENEDATGGNFLNDAGSIYVFKNNSGTWSQQQKIVASDREAGDEFGYSVAISGDYAIIGSWGDEALWNTTTLNDAGAAYILKNNSGTWFEMQKVEASDRWGGDQFGSSVAISGNYAIVGAWGQDTDANGGNNIASAGSAYIFKNNSGTWNQVQKLVASERWTADFFGTSVAISGDYAIIGASQEDEDEIGENTLNDAGAAYIFKNNSGTWSQQQKIVASDREANEKFGQKVAISGENTLIGTPLRDEPTTNGPFITRAGSVYIFKFNSNTWSEIQNITATDRGFDDRFGSSVAISGDNIIIGSPKKNDDATGLNPLNDAGSAYFYKWSCNGIDLTTSTFENTITANNQNATYQWLNCNNANELIAGETDETFSPITNGSYSVVLTESGCVDTSECIEITTIGIIENSFDDELIVYPNPTKGNFSIDLGSIYEESQISIVDISGKIIETKTISQSQILNLFIEEPEGVYIISVKAANKKAVIQLIKE